MPELALDFKSQFMYNWLEMVDIQHITTRLGRWDQGKGPLYKLLATGLRRLLEAGELETGTPLPPERRLAAALTVSRNTVTAAYAELRQDGWVDARRGSATTVTALRHSPVGAYKANGMFATLLQDHPDVIDLTIAVPDAAPIVADVLGDPARHLSMPDALWSGHGYHPSGIPALRQSLADILTGNGLPTDTDQLLVTSGAQQAISLLMRALLRPGDLVGVEEVTYPGALDALGAVGGRVSAIAMTNNGLDVESAEQVLRHQSPRLLYLVPTFHNPSGTLLEGSDRRRLARAVAESNVTTIDDVTLADLDHGTPAPPHLAALEPDAPIITVGSISKVFWGGLRIGFIRAHPTVISHIAGIKAISDLGSNAPAQVGAVAMLEHYRETRSWRNRTLAESLDAVTAALEEHLPEWEWERPQGGPHIWIRLPETDASGFVQLAMRHGVAVIAGPLLAAVPGVATDRIRLPFYRSPEMLTESVERLAAVWKKRGRILDLRSA